MRSTLVSTLQSAVPTIASGLRYTVMAAIIVAVLLYGIMLTTGNIRALKQQSIMLLIKIAAALIFSGFLGVTLGGLVPYILGDSSLGITGFIDYMTSAVLGYTATPTQIALEQAGCPVFSGAQLASNVWFRIDCVIYQLIGSVSQGGQPLNSGILGFLMACIFSPPIGFSVFLFGVAFLWILLLACARALYTLLTAYIALAILILFSPLVIPLILFSFTMPMVDKYIRLFMGVILQPIFLSAYIGLLMLVAQEAIFTGNFSFYNAVTCNPGSSIGDYVAGNGFIMQRSDENAIFNFGMNLTPETLSRQIKSPYLSNTGTMGKVKQWVSSTVNELKGPGNIQIDVPTDMIRWDLLAYYCGATSASQVAAYYINIIASLFIALTIAYIFYTMLSVVPYLSAEVAGGVMSVPGFGALGSRLNPESMAKGFQGTFSKVFSSNQGKSG